MERQDDLFPVPAPTTTALYPNRIADRTRVEATLRLVERGNASTTFYTPKNSLFATGYVRVVYGDHGPYVEFTRAQVKIGLKSKFPNPLPGHCYYEWLEPVDGSRLKVYDQKREVRNLKNPPKGGHAGNRAEGYADYRVGLIYVDPFAFGRIEPT